VILLYGKCFLAASVLAGLVACGAKPEAAPESPSMINPVSYFEIPVTDMDRAMRFYTSLFGVDFERQTVDGYDMALFPFDPDGHGASGALAKGDVYVPSKTGPILYFRVADLDSVLKRAEAQGAKILYPKKDIGENGFVAEIEDSEGNRLALSMAKPKR
jgi:uncharacterized protein